jgi:hypothetical protein
MANRSSTSFGPVVSSMRYASTNLWRSVVQTTFTLTPPLFGFIVGTRAALGFGLGVLLADRIPADKRRPLAFTFIGIGAATTIPAIRALLHSRSSRTVARHGVSSAVSS